MRHAGPGQAGRIAIDGTKLSANATRHEAMSYGQMLESERQLQAEITGLRGQIADMPAKAEQVDAAYQKRSVAIASNLHPAGIDEPVAETLLTPPVDGPLQQAQLVVTRGESFRPGQAEAEKGEPPLN